MAKASPNRNSFNAGVFSALVEGRVDIDKYAASMKRMINFVAAPQGPCMRRSGSYMVTPAYNDAKYSTLVPFVFNEDQALQVEQSDFVTRFILEEGLQAYDADAVTNIVAISPLKFTSAALATRGAAVGDQVALAGFPVEYNINGVVQTITAKAGNDYTVSAIFPGAPGAVSASASLVYAIDSPYDHEDARGIRSLQSVDVLYLFCDGYRPRKLSRYAAYDWRYSTLEFDTGPFYPVSKSNGVLTLGSTGNPVPIMSSDTTPSGLVFYSSQSATHVGVYAFNNDMTTWWEPNASQAGSIGYQAATPFTLVGYTIYMARNNDDTTYTALDYAPGDFQMAGWDGTNWIILDSQTGYVLYDGGRSVTFEVNNTVAYTKYELRVSKAYRNGPIPPRIARLVFSADEPSINVINVALSGDYSKINGGDGFKATDVGRYIRVKGSDAFWRRLKIKEYINHVTVNCTLIDDPFPDVNQPVREWQIGYWSDTTGYPRVGVFFDDRAWMAGSTAAPDLVAGSRVGAYEDFTQRTAQNEVLDDSAIVVRLNGRRLSRVQWMETDERGLLVGTGSAEWVLGSTAADGSAVTAKNFKGRSSTARGSAFIEPVKVDRQILYVQAARRTVREYTYVFESDGYKSPSMSLFASHMGTPRLAQMAYTAEPHTIVWFRRDDGSVVGLTYNRDENVIGWHNHDFAGGIVESVASLPSLVDKQDILWLVVKRTISGQTRRYIERLMRFWDFDSVVEDAHFVDCGLRYNGPATDTLYGLTHLEGCDVEGLADGVPFAVTVTDGKIELEWEAETIIVGLPYESFGETSRIEAGAADGTAQGKSKRANNCSVFVWSSAYGEIGRPNEDNGDDEFQDLEYSEPYDELQPINLQSDIFGPFVLPPGYGKRGSLLFRQRKPLPFNVVALLPQLNTQDR